jgi:rfaE bifunctional protein nucleotidyltransferase chain/domain
MYLVPTKKELDIVNNNSLLENTNHTIIKYKDKVCMKPWGREFLIYQNTKVAIWCVYLKGDHETSVHCHFKKDTLLSVISGSGGIRLIDGDIIPLNILDTVIIPKYKFHGLVSFTDETVFIEIEIFTDRLSFSDKNDLLRIDDPFKRQKTGYETSVSIVEENINELGYFYLDDNITYNFNNNSVIQTHRIINNNDFNKLYTNNAVNILLDGELFSNNKYIRPGSILNMNTTIYLHSGSCLVLTLYKFDAKEDAKIIHNTKQLNIILDKLKREKKKIILTSGCFDILHVGHLHNIKVAKSLGDILFVCLSSDEQIKLLKGPERPINNYDDRINLFKTINYVDYIILYNEENIEQEETLDNIMRLIDPHYWVKGSDYNSEDIKRKHPSLREIYLIPNIDNKSTTNIVSKIKDLNRK